MKRILTVLTLSGMVLVWSRIRAEEPPSSQQQQVEQLQKQLAAMQEEMAALRKAAESKDVPAPTRQAMQQHMANMGRSWDAMHRQCCMMSPTTGCPMGGGMGTGMGMGGASSQK